MFTSSVDYYHQNLMSSAKLNEGVSFVLSYIVVKPPYKVVL